MGETWLLGVMYEMGRVAVGLDPRQRAVAQRFVALVLEFMLAGGDLSSELLLEMFGAHAMTAIPKGCTAGADMDVWYERVLEPVRALLVLLEQAGALERVEERLSVQDGKDQTLHTLRRLFSIDIDTLRRCVDRYERLRPVPSCANAPTRRKNSTQASSWSGILKLAPGVCVTDTSSGPAVAACRSR